MANRLEDRSSLLDISEASLVPVKGVEEIVCRDSSGVCILRALRTAEGGRRNGKQENNKEFQNCANLMVQDVTT